MNDDELAKAVEELFDKVLERCVLCGVPPERGVMFVRHTPSFCKVFGFDPEHTVMYPVCPACQQLTDVPARIEYTLLAQSSYGGVQ